MPLPTRVRERMVSGLKRLVPIVGQQKTRDVSEPDTVRPIASIGCAERAVFAGSWDDRSSANP